MVLRQAVALVVHWVAVARHALHMVVVAHIAAAHVAAVMVEAVRVVAVADNIVLFNTETFV